MAEQVVQQAAIGYSITANIDGRRQVVFQHFVGADETDDQVNATVDRIMKIVDRQVAIYELPDMLGERQKLVDELSQGEADKATVEGNHQRAIADADVQLQTLRKDRAGVLEKAQASFRASGRQGTFKPNGHVKASLDRVDAAIEDLMGFALRAENEKAQHLGNFEISQQRRRDRIAVLDEKIADRRKLAPEGAP